MSLIRKLAGETALYGLSSIIGRLLIFLLTPLYTRTLVDTGDFGVVTDLYAGAAFLMVIFSYRLESAFFRFGTPLADRDRAYATALQSLLTSSGLILLLLLVFAQPIARFMAYPQHPEYIIYVGCILAFDCLAELPFARLRADQRPWRFVFAKMFNIVLTLALNLFWLVFCPWAAKNGLGWVNSVWTPGHQISYIFLSNLIASAATLVLLLPEFALAFRAKFDRRLWINMLVYAGPLVIVGFAGIVNEMLSRSMMKYLLPGSVAANLDQLGIFGANYKLAMLITLFTQAYRYAAEPFFFRHAAHENALKIQADATKWFTIVSTAGLLAILLFLDVVKFFIGKNYREGLDVVPVLLFANLFLGIYYNLSVWYRLKDRTMTGAWISLAGAGITILLNLWWIPLYGYWGAAWVTLICYVFMCLATWWAGRIIYAAPYQWGRLSLYIGAAWGLYGLSLLLENRLAASGVLFWGVHLSLFGAFLGLVFWLERKDLRPPPAAVQP